MSDPDFDEEKPQKPKKYAEVILTMWDDGELDLDCIRHIKTGSGRGAPKKVVMLDRKDFMTDVKESIMSEYGILKFMTEELKLHNVKILHQSDEEIEAAKAAANATPRQDLTDVEDEDDAEEAFVGVDDFDDIA